MEANGVLTLIRGFVTFLPFFVVLLVVGIVKAVIIGTVAFLVMFVGNCSVIIGLWPAHVIWTYYCVINTKRLGLVLKILMLLFLPILLVLWPSICILGSLLGGIGYGYTVPLVATFEAGGEQVVDKLYHSVVDGCWSVIEGACAVVQDCTDFCFHSYFSYMDDLREMIDENEEPRDVKLSKLPSCLLVCVVAIPVDVPAITIVALYKSPYMLLKGWRQLFLDLFGRRGLFAEIVCIPLALPAIVLWPVAVVGAVISSIFCSFMLAFYSAVVVYQEHSFHMGLAFVIAAISLFDEYTNDLLYMREGSYFPRPVYRKNKKCQKPETRGKIESDISAEKHGITSPISTNLVSQNSRTLGEAFKRLKPVQIWDWLFRSCEVNGRALLREGLIDVVDIADCILKGNCKKLSVRLPAWCILQCLLRSARSDAHGLLISDEVEWTDFNWPKDKVLEWLLAPLLIMKDQIRELHLSDNEEACLRRLIMKHGNQRVEDWDDSGFPSDNRVRRAQLQGISRRLQGIVVTLSRLPTFRRRFRNLVKALYMEAVDNGAIRKDGASTRAGDSADESLNSNVLPENGHPRVNNLDIV